MSLAPHPFPILRWFALLWMIVWLPANFHFWGWMNLFHLCDVSIILAFAGIWFANSLLLSSQAVASLVPGILWVADVATRLATGHYLVGGTEYMFDPQYPLWVRLLSTFHLGLPLVLLWTVSKTGYAKSGFVLQSAIALVLLPVSRFVPASLNMNYAYNDPVWHRAWGPAPIHVLLTAVVIIFLIYLPTHLVLRRLFHAAS